MGQLNLFKLLKESHSSYKIFVFHALDIISSCNMYLAMWWSTHTWDEGDWAAAYLMAVSVLNSDCPWDKVMKRDCCFYHLEKSHRCFFLYIRHSSNKQEENSSHNLCICWQYLFKNRFNDHLVNKNWSYEPLITSRTFAFPINNHMHLSNTASISN